MPENILPYVKHQPPSRFPRLLVCAGSSRTDSLHRLLAKAAQKALTDAGAEATYVEMAEFELPVYNQDLEEQHGVPLPAIELRRLLSSHDGLALASPEYNGSYSPLLKNTIDWVSRPIPGERHSMAFKGKVAALMSTTPGGTGGTAGLAQLRQLLTWLGMCVIPAQLSIPRSSQAFDAHGSLVRPEDLLHMDVWAKEVVRLAMPT